ncbi:DUF1109 domain-containing protein [Methyloceanibacter caenitepidi]|uniref:Uncharacterized protein n=1 Tax=Methyloceanibacter caenitepidi TaxID=1384459 RepID=A0A0A8K686_9HYPH|nr:DUF1109 domain-containing protein [Methyloceanibacter caenitepidi]BAQ18057.1 hypothetical protein GL4_2623 [Methyloceanibacter caenitepidi]
MQRLTLKPSSPPAPRRRIAAKTCLAASAALVAMFAASGVRDVFPAMNQDGFAQSLRQSAWTKALSDESAAEAWPWQNVSQNMSALPSAKVRRLGLSAALRDMTETPIEPVAARDSSPSLTSQKPIPRSTQGDVALGDVGSGTVAIGDSITFTANDGATCVYRVTGRPVVDPHLGSRQAEGARDEAGLFECSPLDTFIMRATQGAQKAAPEAHPLEHQRKL